MRIFDFIIQTILFAAALASFSIGKEAWVWVAFIQFFMGCWQLLSAIITTTGFSKADACTKKMIKIYWLAVVVYFCGFGAIYMVDEKELMYSYFFSAWAIAVFYYVFTIQLAFYKGRDKKSFLDIVN